MLHEVLDLTLLNNILNNILIPDGILLHYWVIFIWLLSFFRKHVSPEVGSIWAPDWTFAHSYVGKSNSLTLSFLFLHNTSTSLWCSWLCHCVIKVTIFSSQMFFLFFPFANNRMLHIARSFTSNITE
jgi:hypothetical protein